MRLPREFKTADKAKYIILDILNITAVSPCESKDIQSVTGSGFDTLDQCTIMIGHVAIDVCHRDARALADEIKNEVKAFYITNQIVDNDVDINVDAVADATDKILTEEAQEAKQEMI